MKLYTLQLLYDSNMCLYYWCDNHTLTLFEYLMLQMLLMPTVYDILKHLAIWNGISM